MISLKSALLVQLTAAALLATPLVASADASQCQNLFDFQQVISQPKQQVDVKPSIKKDVVAKEVREELEANYKARNAILAKRYPQLEYVFKDPEAFVETMKQRFEEQKMITPDDPRLFNFPEAASTMKEIRVDLEKFRQELIADLQAEKNSLKNRVSHTVLGKRADKVETITKVLQYVKKVQSDIDVMVDSNNYPYRDTVYTLYYYSRVRGFFQFKELKPYYQVAKYLDMVMHGYRRLNIDDELSLYKAKGSPIVQVRSGKISTEFRLAELPFRDAFENKDKLDFVIIPSVYALGSSAFMHVLPHKIHFIGATNTPVPADGFNRPGGLFWMHDVRHEADRFMKTVVYRKAQNLTPAQEQVLTLYMQKWQAEFLEMKNKIQDPEVKASVEHYHFYTHHDVGVPMIPSMFLDHYKSGMSVYYAFLFHKKNAGQTPEFKNWLENTRKAQVILTQFWTERLPLETNLLGKKPVSIKDWEEWFPKNHGTKTQNAVFNQAIETANLVRVSTERGGIAGTLTKMIYGPQGEPAYAVFSGPAQLVDRVNEVMPKQGPKVHAQGYSTPIGAIKSIEINGAEAIIEQLRAGQNVTIEYASGVIVRGHLQSTTADVLGETTVLTFKTATVTMDQKTLYKPEWGTFDLLLGNSVTSVEFL